MSRRCFCTTTGSRSTTRNALSLTLQLTGRRNGPTGPHWRPNASATSRVLSTARATPNPMDRDRLISRTLYRQMLRWCLTVKKDDFPHEILRHFVPPFHSTAPLELDPYRTELLYEASINADGADGADGADNATDTTDATNSAYQAHDATVVRRVQRLLPTSTWYARTNVTVPIRSLVDLQNCVRALFRLNNVDMPDLHQDEVAHANLLHYQKERRNMAFSTLKTLNELYSDDLAKIQKLRARHLDRQHVTVSWGQVVQHRLERWRGVVVGWDKSSTVSSTTFSSNHVKSSLTTKEYKSSEPNDNSPTVQVAILLDVGDSHHLSVPTGWTTTTDQSNLVAVTDQHLCRVRNNFAESFFAAYDASSCRFLPMPIKAFEYPLDGIDWNASRDLDPSDAQLCRDVSHGILSFASRLESNWRKMAGSRPTTPTWHNFQQQLQALSTGNHGTDKPFSDDTKLTTEASAHVGALLTLSNSVLETMQQRRIAVTEGHKVRFRVGDVVQHKKYGFRGVVVAWDPVPTVNVTRWDGLRDIENPMALPFYQVIPDQQDCIDAFGGERPLRYVCEANLEPCPRDRMVLDVDLDPDWNRVNGAYVAPELLQFKYGADLSDGGIFEQCIADLEARINEWQYQARQSTMDDEAIPKLSLTNMLRLLQLVDSQDDASAIQDTIKEMRKAHANVELRSTLELSLTTLVAGNTKSAHEMYLSLVQVDPTYAEAWNKLATCEFLMGHYKEAEVSTLRALELEPLHYQAIAGLGLLHMERKEYHHAANCFRRNLDLDPWSPVAAKLSHCLDMLDAVGDDAATS